MLCKLFANINFNKIFLVKESTVTTSIYLNKRKVKKDGTYPVKLRLTFRRKSRLYKTNYSLSIKEFDKVISKKPRGIFKEYRISFTTIEQNAINILKKFPVFSFKSFEKRYLRNNFDAKNIFCYFEEKNDKLIHINDKQLANWISSNFLLKNRKNEYQKYSVSTVKDYIKEYKAETSREELFNVVPVTVKTNNGPKYRLELIYE